MKWWLWIGALLSVACTDSGKEAPGSLAEKPFIDLRQLVEKDVALLESKGCSAYKEGIVNGMKDESTVNDINWRKELQVVADADINKKSWIPHLKVDSTYFGDTLQIVCRPSKNDIPIRLISARMLNGAVTEVYVEKRLNSFLFDSEQRITYRPGRSYHISGTQKALFLPRKEFEIASSFNCPQ